MGGGEGDTERCGEKRRGMGRGGGVRGATSRKLGGSTLAEARRKQPHARKLYFRFGGLRGRMAEGLAEVLFGGVNC